jgi:hypothetical protein
VNKLATILLFVSTVAQAQPMMVDPSKMSGIPRPDPQVPAGTITVRLIRGQLANNLPGIEVQLVDGSGAIKTAKSDESGRATFSGLGGGPFTARASDGNGNELSSQPIELPPTMGVRVMLVFPLGAGAPDGVGHPDKSVPAGEVLVRAVDGEGQPLTGLEVMLGHARAGEQQVQQTRGTTDAKGEAHFPGLDAKPTSGYLAEVLKLGARFAGKPFRMSENMGTLVVIEVRPVSKDMSTVSIGERSHLILDITDDAVQVIEVLRLVNSGTAAVDVGPAGLHIPLPANAVSAQAAPESPPSFTVVGHEAIWKGQLPPGDTNLQIRFVLAYQGDRLEVRQAVIIPFTEVNFITERIDGLTVEGNGTETQDREMSGRKLLVGHGPGVARGGEIALTMIGLPHSTAAWRLAAAALSLAILIGFGIYAAQGDASTLGTRRKLEQKRDHLLEELVALEARGGDDAKLKKKREELTDKLARLYRELDEVEA